MFLHCASAESYVQDLSEPGLGQKLRRKSVCTRRRRKSPSKIFPDSAEAKSYTQDISALDFRKFYFAGSFVTGAWREIYSENVSGPGRGQNAMFIGVWPGAVAKVDRQIIPDLDVTFRTRR
jgi:hypothetical protein